MAVPVRNAPLSPDAITPAMRPGVSAVPNPVAPVAPVVMNPGQTATPNTPPVATGAIRPAGAYNPYTKGFETVTPKTGVNMGQYSPDAKQAMWQQSGQQGPANMDAFYRMPNGSMGIKPEFVKNVDPNGLTDANGLNAYLNGAQNASFMENGGNVANTSLADVMNQLGGMKGNAPENFNRAQAYGDLRAQNGVADLEGQLSEIERQYAEEEAAKRTRTQGEQGKLASTGVISGRVTEVERQQNERMDSLNRQRNAIGTQLQAKNATINSMMNYMGEDYNTASQRYDAEFNKNVQITNLARGIHQDQVTEADKLKDNARATLTTIYNAALSGGMDPKTLPESQKANIGKLELQSGLPPGFITNLYDKNPKSDIVFSWQNVETDGNQYLNVVLRDKVTGEMKTQKFMLGKSADFAIKQQNADTNKEKADAAAVKAAKYKTGWSGGSKAKTSSSDKAAVALKGKIDTLLGNLRVKISTGDMENSDAHNEAYQKYGKEMIDLWYTDAQAKNYLYNGLK